MRVLLLLATSSVTGPAELCLDDARGLAKAGHQVLFGLDTRRPGNYAEAVRAAGFEVLDQLALSRKSGPIEFVQDVARLRQRLWNVDLIHCRFSHDHTLALAAIQGLPERPALIRSVETARSVRCGWVRSLALRACDAVIAPCQDYALRLKQDHKIAPISVHVLPGRVDGRTFSPGDGSAMRASWGVGAGEVLFGIVSRIKSDRRHDVLLRAFARVALERPKAKLAIVGRGEQEPQLRALASGLGLDGRVVFAGYRAGKELIAAYRALDVNVWLAEGNDGTCRAVLEALACGVPVIAGNQGAMAEIVRDGIEGRVVAVDDEAVAEALRALADPAIRKALARAAPERARQYSPAARAQKLGNIYSDALKAAGR